MTTATWNGATIAESDKTVVVEGNHYFPPGSIRKEFLQAEFEDEPLSVEGYGEVLLVGGGRKDQRGRRVVLPGAVDGGREHQGLRGFLERR